MHFPQTFTNYIYNYTNSIFILLLKCFLKISYYHCTKSLINEWNLCPEFLLHKSYIYLCSILFHNPTKSFPE